MTLAEEWNDNGLQSTARTRLSINLLILEDTWIEGQGDEFSKNLEKWSTILEAPSNHFIWCVDLYRLRL